jgi:26S proteasome regulatory subunit N1
MVSSNEDSLECLQYCLSGTQRDLKSWGHEYLRSLSGQIGQEYLKRVEDSKPFDDLMKLVDVIIPEFINHNEEPEAVDLLMEVEQLAKLHQFTNESNFERVCNYL